MKKIYVYEIFLDEILVTNSGEAKFNTEQDATEDAITFIINLLKMNSEYDDYSEDDFNINISEITEDDFARGW